MHIPLLILLSYFLAPVLCLFSCPAKDPNCLNSFFNDSSILNTFLGDHGTVIFQNGVLANTSSCAALTVLFARGTAEPGNVGILTGPAFFASIAAYMNGTNQVAIQGVEYPADLAGFLSGGSQIGITTMTQLINTTLSKCPSTLLTLSGYSQGALLVRTSLSQLPSSTSSKISSVILFGDPKNGTALENIDNRKVVSICHANDDICAGGKRVGIAHLDYSRDAARAAGFVVNGAGMGMLGISSLVKGGADGGIG